MNFVGFRGGVHPPDNKAQTAEKATEKMASPKMVYIPLQTHRSPVRPE